ncbi:hypothetical protein [Amycolatopsis anabasis]|uniref:hypothetical protein n=1 Tax=Amycolatopsis anabasis TaxID=1840409 RepID=UPI00131D8F78|nr:hypothetical protein [Amycolatopsis anabasis]
MSYPQYPGAPGYPPPQAGYPYPAMPRKPSGGTAITAGVLAVIVGLWHLVGLVRTVVHLVGHRFFLPGLIIPTVLSLVLAVLVLLGALLLFLRKPAGRFLVITGAALGILYGLVILVLDLTDARLGGLRFGMTLESLLAHLFEVAVLVLACLPPTGRWVRHRVLPTGYPTPYPAPPPGYPPQGW